MTHIRHYNVLTSPLPASDALALNWGLNRHNMTTLQLISVIFMFHQGCFVTLAHNVLNERSINPRNAELVNAIVAFLLNAYRIRY